MSDESGVPGVFGAVDPPSRSWRRPGSMTLALLLPVPVLWLASLFPVSLAAVVLAAATHTGDGGATALVLVWTFGALVVVSRPGALVLARLVDHARPATLNELAELRPLWEATCRRAGVQPGGYSLRVQDSSRINALALGSRVVVVTRTALSLPQPMLQGILAHELGHHNRLHSAALGIVGWWYALPTVGVGLLLRGVIRTIATLGAFATGWFTLVVVGAILYLWLIRWLLELPVAIASGALRLIGRRAEYAADRFAADRGFGHELRAALQYALDSGADDIETRSRQDQRFATHPPLAKRISAIDARMARR